MESSEWSVVAGECWSGDATESGVVRAGVVMFGFVFMDFDILGFILTNGVRHPTSDRISTDAGF